MSRSLLQKLKPYYVRKALRYLRHYGPKDFLIRVRERLAPEEVPYGPWYEAHRAKKEALDQQRALADAEYIRQQDGPMFSVIVPAWRTPQRYLEELLQSVLNQTFQDFELVIADASPRDEGMNRILEEAAGRDERIRVLTLAGNRGIAENTNAAISRSRGTYLCFMDHDDVISPDALFEAWQIIRSKEVDLIYTDEDKIREGTNGKAGEKAVFPGGEHGEKEHFQPHFKPQFNLDLLRSNNYICHFLMVRRSLVLKAGGLRQEYEGAQDYEFILRLTDRISAERIAHIPKVLYHWRTHEQSTADNPDSKQYAYESGRRALQEHLERRSTPGQVLQTKDHGFYRIKYALKERPLVSIIIPNRESEQMLQKCIGAIREHTRYENYEVIVAENNSSSRGILDYYRTLREEGIRVVRWKSAQGGPSFNFSAINNYAERFAKGEYLVFLNNDVEVGEGWLEELLSVCLRPEVGAAGPKLFYPDGSIQSAGIVVGIGGVAGSLFAGMRGSFSGYLHKASLMQDLSAVTAAMMIVRRSVFRKVGGFDEDLAVAFNDVDLCLKIRRENLLVVYDPFVQAVHHESVSRGDEYTREKAQRYRMEAARMKEKWPEYYEKGDPYYNPNFSLKRWDYTLQRG